MQKDIACGTVCGHGLCHGWGEAGNAKPTPSRGILCVVGTGCWHGVVQVGVSTGLDTITMRAATFIPRERAPEHGGGTPATHSGVSDQGIIILHTGRWAYLGHQAVVPRERN